LQDLQRNACRLKWHLLRLRIGGFAACTIACTGAETVPEMHVRCAASTARFVQPELRYVRIFERNDGGKNQHNERRAAQMKLEGLPEGYEAVRWGWPAAGELFLDSRGDVILCHNTHMPGLGVKTIIVHKVEPVATWPQGVFRDRWIAEDADGKMYWHDYRPTPEFEQHSWTGGQACPLYCIAGPVTFRLDLPWRERCIQVGPSVEGADNG
jgi:hypothetical protein